MTTDEDRSLGFLISDAARLMRTVFDRRVRRLGLTRAQWLVLARLHRRPGASQSELADMMEVEKASAGRMVDRLERKGWVERRSDPVDRRINRLYLTAEAENISQRMRAVAERTVGDALADLSPAQSEQLTGLMGTVKDRLLAIASVSESAEPLHAETHVKPNLRTSTRRTSLRASTSKSNAVNRAESTGREMADVPAARNGRVVIAGGSTP